MVPPATNTREQRRTGPNGRAVHRRRTPRPVPTPADRTERPPPSSPDTRPTASGARTHAQESLSSWQYAAATQYTAVSPPLASTPSTTPRSRWRSTAPTAPRRRGQAPAFVWPWAQYQRPHGAGGGAESEQRGHAADGVPGRQAGGRPGTAGRVPHPPSNGERGRGGVPAASPSQTASSPVASTSSSRGSGGQAQQVAWSHHDAASARITASVSPRSLSPSSSRSSRRRRSGGAACRVGPAPEPEQAHIHHTPGGGRGPVAAAGQDAIAHDAQQPAVASDAEGGRVTRGILDVVAAEGGAQSPRRHECNTAVYTEKAMQVHLDALSMASVDGEWGPDRAA